MPGFCSGCAGQGNALREMEEIGGIITGLDLLQAWQVGSIISLLPGVQARVDVVLIRASARIWAQFLPHTIQPGVVGCDGGSGSVRVPVCCILGGKERVTMDKGRCAGGNAVNRAAIGIQPDTACAECSRGL